LSDARRKRPGFYWLYLLVLGIGVLVLLAAGVAAESLRLSQAGSQSLSTCQGLVWPLSCIVLLQSAAIALLFKKMRQRERAERLLQQEQLLQEGVNRDLEQRIRQEVEKSRAKDRLMLQQSRFAAMGEMIGNIAHQWRQPLNTLGLVIQQIQMEQEKGVMTDRLMKERVGKAMELLLNLSRTIDDFRNFFGQEVEAAPFKLAQVAVKTVNFFEPSCQDHDIKVSIEGGSDLLFTGRANEFSQALLNILNNARDALLESRPAKPWIAVGIRDDQQRTVITVRDNAGGIDAEIIGKIFDPYFTTKEEGKGTGIGLYMAKSIIGRNMHGQLSVSNLTEGAEFKIVI